MSIESAEETLALHLLGAPRLIWQGAPLKIVRRQARALLYRLAAQPAPVSREHLAFLFWPDEPDAKARRNLSRLLSYLRKELPHPDCLLLNRRAVRLNPDWAWSDCVVLEEAHESGEVAVLEKSADLYRSRFLEGFSAHGAPEFAKWREQRAAELESVYLGVLSRLTAVLSERNQIKSAVRYAQRYLALDELAEEIHRRLITLYGRAGDRASATRQFERCSLLLERELGVSHLPETRDAYQTALRDGPSPLPTRVRSPSWSVLPSLELPLVGRDEALHALENAARRLASGGLILITGEAGVGKSRLLQSFALGGERMPLTGNSHRGSQSISYQPLVHALRQSLDAPHSWRRIRPIWLAEVGRLLPELSHIFPDLPGPLDVAPQEAQGRLLEAVTRCLFRLARERSILLCLDDLHWSDGATLRWLIDVSGRFPDSRLLIAATARLAEVQALADVKRAFRRVNRLVEIPLGGLAPAAIARALEEMELGLSEETLGDFAERLHSATGGNTFFVLETVRTLMESDRLQTPTDSLPLATTVEDAVHSRFETLTAVSQQLLQAAAVLSPDLEPDLLRHTAGRSDLEVVDALDELVARQLLREEDNGHRFSHDLVRNALYRDMSPWRRRLLHRRAAEAMRAEAADGQLYPLAALAQHFDAAAATREAVYAYQDAAAAAAAVYGYDQAIGHLQRALALLGETEVEWTQAADLYTSLGEMLAHVARFEDARAAFREALAARSPDDPLPLALLHRRIADTHQAQLYYDRVQRRLVEALHVLEHSGVKRDKAWQRLWLNIKLRFIHLHFCLHQPDKCEALIGEVTSTVERIGTGRQQMWLTNDKIHVALLRERYRSSAATIALAARERERARQTLGPQSIALYDFFLGYCFLLGDDLASAEAPLLASLFRAQAIAHRMQEARSLAFLSTLYRQRGEPQRARDFSLRALEASREVGSRHFEAHALATGAWLDFHDGKISSARAAAQQAVSNFIDTNVPLAWLALIVLLAIQQRKGQIEKAVESASTMLHPEQRRLPDPLTDPLRQAVAHCEANNSERADGSLQQAIASALEIGYL